MFFTLIFGDNFNFWFMQTVFAMKVVEILQKVRILWRKQVFVYIDEDFANNKGADQPAHTHSLISALIICSFESIISRLATSKISSF